MRGRERFGEVGAKLGLGFICVHVGGGGLWFVVERSEFDGFGVD